MTEKDIKNILESELHTIQLHTKIKTRFKRHVWRTVNSNITAKPAA